MRRDPPGPRPPSALPAVAIGALLFACQSGPDEMPDDPHGCGAPLADLIELADLEQHLRALADIGDAHAGTRLAGSGGFDASADYVAEHLLAAGLTVRRESFQFDDFVLHVDPRLDRVTPAPLAYELGVDFRAATFSGSGDVAGPVIPIDLSLGPGNESTSGCEPEDFAEFFPSSIALIQRGGCYHHQKIANAVAAGAAAVVYFNQGTSVGTTALFNPRLTPGTTIPVIALSYAVGEALAGSGSVGLQLHLAVDGDVVVRDTVNVLAETPATASGRVVMLGAHLDSVAAGPGINDNGSGVAALLGVGANLPLCRLRHQVRLAFWGAEEYGLLGSTHYVGSRTELERAAIALYINLDMIASPNPVRFIYDGDGSAWQQAGPDGSAAIEAAFAAYFAELGLVTRETAFDGRSDYWAFINHDIAAGGLFTGAEDHKTAHEAELFGGEAELAYDPCYHAACDDRDNYDPDALRDNSRAAAHVIETFATSDPPLPPQSPPTPPRAAQSGPPAHACDDRR